MAVWLHPLAKAKYGQEREGNHARDGDDADDDPNDPIGAAGEFHGGYGFFESGNRCRL